MISEKLPIIGHFGKPHGLFYTRGSKGEKFHWKENVMSCDEEICSTYNGFFASTMSNSNIPTIEPLFN